MLYVVMTANLRADTGALGGFISLTETSYFVLLFGTKSLFFFLLLLIKCDPA